MQPTRGMIVVAFSVLTAFALPATFLSTPPEKSDKTNQPAGSSGSMTQVPAPATLEIMDSIATLTMQVSNPQDLRATTTVYLRNDGDAAISKVTFSAALQDENGKSYSLSEPPSETNIGTIGPTSEQVNAGLSGHSVKSFELLVKLDKGLPAFDDNTYIPHTLSGYLTVKGDEKLIKNRPLKLVSATPSLQAAYPIWFGLVCAAVVVVLSILLFRIRLNRRMGLPEWTASGSLATNLTATGTVLTTLVASTALPVSTHILQKNEYSTLALLFGVLALLAPIIYSSIRLPSSDPNATPDSPNEGYAGMFLLTCIVSLWAVFGQLATAWYLIGELWVARFMPRGAVSIFRTCIAVVAILLFVYGLVAIRIKVHKSIKVHKTRAAGAPAVAPAAAAQPLPKWRML